MALSRVAALSRLVALSSLTGFSRLAAHVPCIRTVSSSRSLPSS